MSRGHVKVGLTTLLGAFYHFPDMPVAEAESLRQQLQGREQCTQLVLHNVSGAVLVMPARIVGIVRIEGKVVWRHPSLPV